MILVISIHFPSDSSLKKTIRGLMSSLPLPHSCKKGQSIVLHPAGHTGFWFGVQLREEEKPQPMKPTPTTRKHDWEVKTLFVSLLYRVQALWRLQTTKKPIPCSKSIGYPISHFTVTIDLFLGSGLSYQVDILNCPRKLAALPQFKTAFAYKAGESTLLSSQPCSFIFQHPGQD